MSIYFFPCHLFEETSANSMWLKTYVTTTITNLTKTIFPYHIQTHVLSVLGPDLVAGCMSTVNWKIQQWLETCFKWDINIHLDFSSTRTEFLRRVSSSCHLFWMDLTKCDIEPLTVSLRWAETLKYFWAAFKFSDNRFSKYRGFRFGNNVYPFNGYSDDTHVERFVTFKANVLTGYMDSSKV